MCLNRSFLWKLAPFWRVLEDIERMLWMNLIISRHVRLISPSFTTISSLKKRHFTWTYQKLPMDGPSYRNTNTYIKASFSRCEVIHIECEAKILSICSFKNKSVRTTMRLKWTFWDILGHCDLWDNLGRFGKIFNKMFSLDLMTKSPTLSVHQLKHVLYHSLLPELWTALHQLHRLQFWTLIAISLPPN